MPVQSTSADAVRAATAAKQRAEEAIRRTRELLQQSRELIQAVARQAERIRPLTRNISDKRDARRPKAEAGENGHARAMRR